MLQNWFNKIGITKSDLRVLGLCAGFLLPFMYNDFAEYWVRHGVFAGILNALFFYFKIFIVALIVVYYLLPFYLTKKNAFVLLILLLLLLITEGVLARYTYQFICGCPLKINYDTVSSEMQFTAMIAAPVSMVLFVKRLLDSQNRYLTVEKEKKEAELKLLKQQIDPHFLFNNLNVLGVLIQNDKVAANEYLHRFSNLYRYLIRHKDEDVVLLEEELTFVKDYIYLLKQRFGEAYDFTDFTNLSLENIPNCLVLPGAIQALVENIIKHNQGEESQPLQIFISVENNYFTIKNEVRAKFNVPHSTKTGLKNLQTRYQLLSDKGLIINVLDDFFEVKIPLISQIKT